MTMRMRFLPGDTGTHSPRGLWSGDHSVMILKALLPFPLYNISLQETDFSLRTTMDTCAARVYQVEASPGEASLLSYSTSRLLAQSGPCRSEESRDS